MANCGSCGKSVGCSCSLVKGKCVECYAKSGEEIPSDIVVRTKSKQRIVYPRPKPVLSEKDIQINEVMRDKTLSREERLKRIDNIIKNVTNS